MLHHDDHHIHIAEEGVEVVDDYAENPVLTIDNTAVDLNVVGNYPVTYKAVDDVGNVTEETITVSVVLNYSAGLLEDESYEEVVAQAYEMAAEILKTLEKHDLENLLLLGGVILMRVILALVIRFELKDHNQQKKED